ncbi:GNAT family N-acetyltransferase [Megalodesulfovibrio gigas]|uniref:Putative acetyltransferase n=1 Tax=Megalodesulfovibrio gigas (strain ATCC 19364 / DSM 1382 / NCIMB 9332 / VKM B-1759) TaxID=1121448 RepID=T2G9N0_MEGG1|nr:GNAT family N-acetyltransferase [Megalodesulfovibrio gigas]AGW12993.1 putative acetyltransferase [Megalodesulfovibrio gigas DSM 1382 = ATCC 19364]
MTEWREYQHVVGGAELLAAVEPLWVELCEHHAQVAPVFATMFRCRPFADRAAEILAHAQGGLRVELAMADDAAVGFCIGSVAASGAGEVDSIFVQAAHRGAGLGEVLMRHALDWLEQQDAAPVTVAVVSGNDRALHWYERFGFTPRRVQLVRTRHTQAT